MKRFSLLFCLLISLSLFPFLNYCLAFEPSNDNIYKGIDISQWQENINFTKVKNNGVEIVYIKATQGNDYIDPYFKRNYQNAKDVGFKIGVYHFLTARNIEEAIDEADFFCSVISNKKINCKLAMDFESFGRLTKEQINEISLAFLERVEQNTGKELVIYSDTYNAKKIFSEELAQKYPVWIAEYGVDKPNSNGKWNTWIGFQYTDKGRVDGITDFVDRDYYTSNIFLNDESLIKESSHRNNIERIRTIKVKRGDTLSKLAIKYKTTVNLIIGFNNIKNKNLIYIGQILKIPYSTQEVKGETNHILYTIKRGDTLTQIAKKFNTTVSELVKLNHIKNPNLIYAGDTLKIKNEKIE